MLQCFWKSTGAWAHQKVRDPKLVNLILRWPGDSQRESGRFARSDSQKHKKKTHFIACERFARIASKNLRFATFSPPKRDSQKGVQFESPETIRENQAIRTNLRIDSRESGHLRSYSCVTLSSKFSMGARQRSWRRRRAEKRLSERAFWRVRSLSAPLRFSDVLRANLKGAEKKRTLQKHPLENRFSARRLLRSFGVL